MDIRISSYRANAFTGATVTASSPNKGPLGVATVQNAATSSPVAAVRAVSPGRSGLVSEALGQVANGGASGGGYTDSVRGSLVNILA